MSARPVAASADRSALTRRSGPGSDNTLKPITPMIVAIRIPPKTAGPGAGCAITRPYSAIAKNPARLDDARPPVA